MWHKTSQVKKIFSCARASHSSQKCDKCNASHFLSPKKWQMWRHSPKSETRTWEEIRLRPTLSLESVRRVILGGGVRLVGPQEELHYPSGYTPRGFTFEPRARGEGARGKRSCVDPWLNPKKVGKNVNFPKITVRMDSGWWRVARRGSGAKAPPLSAFPFTLLLIPPLQTWVCSSQNCTCHIFWRLAKPRALRNAHILWLVIVTPS